MRSVMLSVLAACASEPDTIDDDDALSVAMSIASTLRPAGGGGELGAMLDASAIVRGELPTGFTADDDDVRGVHFGFPYAYRPTCRDDHNTVGACDAHTDNADVGATWAGVLAMPFGASVTAREGTWMVNDITAERLRLDGASHLEYAAQFASESGVSRHELAYDASQRGVVIVRGERWPRSGEVRYALSVAHTIAGVRRAFDVTATVRFLASGHATIVLPDHELDLDFSTGAVHPVR